MMRRPSPILLAPIGVLGILHKEAELAVARAAAPLGVPFVVSALAFRRAMGAFGWVKQHYVWVVRTGGAMLICIGLLLVTGIWNDITVQLQVWVSGFTPAV